MERHHLILPAIGVFQQEEDAYNLAVLLRWLLPLIVILASLLDLVLMMVYMKNLHPWKGILEVRD